MKWHGLVAQMVYNLQISQHNKKNPAMHYLAWEKPEEHVAIIRFIDSEEAGITQY